jgi:hypothetical protein
MVYIAGEGTVAGSPGFENQICEVHNRIIKPTEECFCEVEFSPELPNHLLVRMRHTIIMHSYPRKRRRQEGIERGKFQITTQTQIC